jgi:hypothetical protein
MATTAAHAGRTAAPGQAKPSPDQRCSTQHHRGGTTEGTITPGMSASGESPRNRATLVAVGLGANREGLQSQIDAGHLMRRRKASQMRPISPPEMAGDGRINSATAAATTDRQSDGRGLGLGRVARGVRRVSDRSGRLDPSRFSPTRWATLTGGPRGKFGISQIPNKPETWKFHRN